MNILMCSVGRRCELIKDFRSSMEVGGKIVATDNSPYAPALYFADKTYIVPRITDPSYIDILLSICDKEKIQAVMTLIDPEIAILSENRDVFEKRGILMLVPYLETAKMCFDKFEMFQHLEKCGLPTIQTFESFDAFSRIYKRNEISFPVFVKPRTGSGSVGARKVNTIEELQDVIEMDSTLIIQEYMDGEDLDADVYVDTQSREVVSVFSKKKISTTIGGANKTISFKDEQLFNLVKKISSTLELCGPNDMDFFYKNGRYYLSEINPRFGGAYLHAYGAGIDFIKLIEKNVLHKENKCKIGNYEEGVVMMMYDSVVIRKKEDLAEI